MNNEQKPSFANKRFELISVSLFLKVIFLLIVIIFAVVILLKSDVNFGKIEMFSPPVYSKQDSVDTLSQEDSQITPSRIQPVRPFYNFTDFSKSSNKTGVKLWESMKPSFDCPKHLQRQIGGPQIGGKGDGGKWTCGLDNLGKLRLSTLNENAPCVVYSFGVNHDSSFEAEVLATTHCEVYAYDPSVDKIGKPLVSSNPRVHFKKLGISGDNLGDMRTLKTLMEDNGGHRWIDILKMDIELSEYPSLENILEDFAFVGNSSLDGLPFGQLLVEMHIKKVEEVEGAKDVVKLFKTLEENGLRMFYNDIKPSCLRFWCSEIAFININEFNLERVLGNE